MSARAVGGAALAAAQPVIWSIAGYPFEAGPLIVTLCAVLMTRLIVSMQAKGRRRVALDILITGLSMMVSALWVQAHHLDLLPAGLTGIGFGALGVGIIGLGKTQAASALGVAFGAAFQTFLRTAAAPPPASDQDQDLIDRLDNK